MLCSEIPIWPIQFPKPLILKKLTATLFANNNFGVVSSRLLESICSFL